MILHRTLRRVFPAFALAILCFAGAPARADGAENPASFIDGFGHRAIAQLTEPDLSDTELFSRFRTLFEEGFDVPFIARSALGRFWPRATETERADYVAAFEDYMVKVYAMKFRQYSGESFQTTGSRPGPGDATSVMTTVVKPDGPQTPIEWIVAEVGGKPKIRDIKIEGVSMITSYRDQFANEILQHNGKVAGLIDALRAKTAEFDANKG